MRLLENAVENPDRIEHTHEADGGDASHIRGTTGALVLTSDKPSGDVEVLAS